jgi:hypothetical protein
MLTAALPVRRGGRNTSTMVVNPISGPLTSTGYRRCRDWQEQWLALPRQVTPTVVGPNGAVHSGADGLRRLAAILVPAAALPRPERVAQLGPALE